MPTPEPESGAADNREPTAADILGTALGDAARRAGLDPTGNASAPRMVWSAMGGWRGIVESVLPSLTFLVLFTFRPEPLLLPLGASVGLAALFTVIRVVQRSAPAAAISGLVAAGAAALLALWTGRGEDNFLLGFLTNAAYGSALLVSALLGWSLIGLAAGFLLGEGTRWRADRKKRRAYFWLGVAWAGLFFARLAVQLPLYFAHDVTALATVKLAMGLPLFAPMVAVTWLVIRATNTRGTASGAPGQA